MPVYSDTLKTSLNDLPLENIIDPQQDKNNKMTFAPSEDSDQPGHPPNLIRVFAVRSTDSQGPNGPSCEQRRLWSDWADAQADLSLRWAHRLFCWFCRAAAHYFNNEKIARQCHNHRSPHSFSTNRKSSQTWSHKTWTHVASNATSALFLRTEPWEQIAHQRAKLRSLIRKGADDYEAKLIALGKRE